MAAATPAIHDLARRVIAFETARDPSDGPGGAAVRACETLRVPLAKLAGVAGFRSLMTRAVALATADVPWLAAVRVRADGSVEGFAEARTDPGAMSGGDAGGVVVVRLLGLLGTFIGEPLTLGLVRDAWPDAPAVETDRSTRGQP